MGVTNAFPRSLGFKLPLDWRARAAREDLRIGDGDPYAFLAACGYRFVELATGPCVARDELDALHYEARACRDAGLTLALHPYLWGSCNPAHLGDRPEPTHALGAVLRAASDVGEFLVAPVTVILHPAEARFEPGSTAASALRAQLLDRSRRFFAEIERRLADSHPGVVVLAEHQLPTRADEPVIRIGDTCAELLDAVAGTSLGLCWDTGHYLLGIERYAQPEPPPPEFLERVRHVHLHDVVAGTDHRVVGPGSVRVRGYMEALQYSAFAGTVTLEYAWDAVQSSGGIEKVAREAPGILATWSLA